MPGEMDSWRTGLRSSVRRCCHRLQAGVDPSATMPDRPESLSGQPLLVKGKMVFVEAAMKSPQGQ